MSPSFRVELNGLGEVSDVTVELSFLIMSASPVGVGGGMVRLKLDGLGEVGNGAVEFRRLEMRGPPLEVGGGIIGVGFNRLGVRDGTLNLLLFVPIRPCLCYGPPNQSKPWKTYHWGHSQ